MRIPLNKLTAITPGRVKAAIQFNMEEGNSWGSGNRAARRLKLPMYRTSFCQMGNFNRTDRIYPFK